MGSNMDSQDLAGALIRAAAALEAIAGEIAVVAQRIKTEPSRAAVTAQIRSDLARRERQQSACQMAIAAYVDAYRQRYGAQTCPDLRGKMQGVMKRLATEVPIERLRLLLQTYLQMPDPWFATKCHDLVTFSENLGKVGLALDGGRANPSEKTWEDVLAAKERASTASLEGVHGDQDTLQLTD